MADNKSQKPTNLQDTKIQKTMRIDYESQVHAIMNYFFYNLT